MARRKRSRGRGRGRAYGDKVRASVLYIEVVQSGLSGAGSRLGHCDSCWERDGVGLRQLDYWGLK